MPYIDYGGDYRKPCYHANTYLTPFAVRDILVAIDRTIEPEYWSVIDAEIMERIAMKIRTYYAK